MTATFGFLTTRTLKAKRRWQKRIGTFLSGMLTLIPTGLLVLELIGFTKLSKHYINPVIEVQIAGTPDQIARGEKLANLCVNCHTPDNQLPLSGSNFTAKFEIPPLGKLYAPNLTPSGNIKNWTDGEVIRAIREGIHKSGRSLLVMPSATMENMSDEDVQALVAFLRSQPATGQPTPETQFNVLGAIFMNLSDFRTAQPPVSHVTAPETGTLAYGKYLVDILGCRDSHGDQLQGKVENSQPGPPPGPNLSLIVPNWTEAEFMNLFNTGTLPGGSKVPILTLKSGFSSPKCPGLNFGQTIRMKN